MTLAAYGNQLKTLGIGMAAFVLDLGVIVEQCPNLVTLEITGSVLRSSEIDFAVGQVRLPALQNIDIDIINRYLINKRCVVVSNVQSFCREYWLPNNLLSQLLSMPDLRSLKLTTRCFIGPEDWQEATQMATDGRLQHLQMMHVHIKKFGPFDLLRNIELSHESMLSIYRNSPKLVDAADCTITYDCDFHDASLYLGQD